MKYARALRLPENTMYSSAYLLCGGSPTTVVATWEAVTDGSFKVTMDGTLLSITGIDFTGAGSMAGVAAIIQVALRAATDASGAEQVVWDSVSSRFVVYSGITTSSSAISKLTAGASGTDISGAGGTAFMDGDAGATGELVVDAVEGYQSLTNAYATLHRQFPIQHANQMSLKMVHKAQATTNSPTITYKMEVSDDPMSTSEDNSIWHPIGSQDNAGGTPATLTDEDYQVVSAGATATTDSPKVPLRYTDTAQKARVRVKSNVAAGLVKGTVGYVQH